MEESKKPKVVRKLMESTTVKKLCDGGHDYTSEMNSMCSFPSNNFSNLSRKKLFSFPPPPLFSSSDKNQYYYNADHGESDNSVTTGSATDVEDNSDSQSDAAGINCFDCRRVSRCRHNTHCSGSHSDTGFSAVAGSRSLRLRSSPVPIQLPLHSVRGYESDGSPLGVRSQARFLPPIGVFWDIENCQVPKGRSAVAVAQLIREKFFEGHREAEFLVVCDVKKENAQVIAELNDAQVNLIHVAATCKNAADEKLRQAIRRFAEIYESPAAIILISGDINFAADLTDLRHRKKIHVILIHNSNTSETLILCANENYNFSTLVENLPLRGALKSGNQVVEVVVSNLPADKEHTRIKNRLKKLSDNCGGRVGNVVFDKAIIRFPTIEFAFRAQKRMDGEDVFGNKISVSRPHRTSVKENESPFKNSPDFFRGGRSSLRQTEDCKVTAVKDRHSSHTTPNCIKQSDCQQGMFSNKVHGNNPPPSVHDNVQASLPSFNISQTGIGTANFYRNTPPPRIVLGSQVLQGAQPASRPPLVNGWNFMPSASQPQLKDTSTSAIATASSLIQQHPPAQRWPVTWSTTHNMKQAPSLQVASQSLSALTACLPNSGTGDYTPDVWRHSSGSQGGKADVSVWESASSSFHAPITSPIKGSTAPLTRTPSPTMASSVSQPPFGHPRVGAGDCLLWTNQQCVSNGSANSALKSRTPSPYSLVGDSVLPNQVSRKSWSTTSKASPANDAKDLDHYFNPINTPQTRQTNLGVNGPIELQVTNLDQSMDAREMKRVLSMLFREHVAVLHVSVFVQSDGNLAASVRVSSLQDAQYAVSQLHRKKIGFKRIQISYSQSGPAVNPVLVRSQIVSMLQEVPGHRLPLFKFREMFENRYLSTISVSDMYKLRDVCLVSEDPSGRMVTLNPEHRNTPSPLLSNTIQDGQLSMDLPYCPEHYQKANNQDKGWAEQELAALPNVRVGLRLFAQRVHALLISHNGHLPLPSFTHCYEAQFGSLNVEESGVPLEHLVSCVSGVELHQGIGCVKYLKCTSGKDSETASEADGNSGNSTVSPPLAGQLALFSRELVDLLKTAPSCQLSFNRFIPAYHHHFGRQCRVADYGFTKLIQLFEALPNVVQVLGEGNKRIVTLSHRAQIRRFTSDLLRVLKSQYSKQVLLSEFPAAYQRVLNRQFDVVNYGVCFVQDLLNEIGETTVLVSAVNDSSDILIAIPKREQTPEEIEKTKQFASEVLQLLRFAPQCSMDFSKFIPYYHHHFGRQCRVADFGFTKLIELFEAIPHVVKISEDDDGERKVQLTLQQRLHVLGEHIASSIRASGQSFLPLSVIIDNYLRDHGYPLRPEEYALSSAEELMQAVHFSVKMFEVSGELCVGVVDQNHLLSLGICVRHILWERQDCRMSATEFCEAYMRTFKEPCDFESLQKDLENVIEISRESDGIALEIRLTPIQVLAKNICLLLCESDGRLPLSSFESNYIQRFGKAIQPAQFGFSTVLSLLLALPDLVSIQGRGQRRYLVLEGHVAGESYLKNEKQVWPSVNGENSGRVFTPTRHDNNKSAESPDTILKKLIRNLSNQESPAKQRVCSDRTSGTALGYRPLGFATSQQPLNNVGNHHFAWEPAHPAMGGYSTFTVPISFPTQNPSSPSPHCNGFPGGQASQPPSPRCASLPLVQPPHPSALPMPHMTLKSHTSSDTGDTAQDTELESAKMRGKTFDEINDTAQEVNCDVGEESHLFADDLQDAASSIMQEGSASGGRTKRKQRLAIQFNSPLVPIQ